MEFKKDLPELRSDAHNGHKDHFNNKKRSKIALFAKIITDYYKISDYFELHALNSI